MELPGGRARHEKTVEGAAYKRLGLEGTEERGWCGCFWEIWVVARGWEETRRRGGDEREPGWDAECQSGLVEGHDASCEREVAGWVGADIRQVRNWVLAAARCVCFEHVERQVGHEATFSDPAGELLGALLCHTLPKGSDADSEFGLWEVQGVVRHA